MVPPVMRMGILVERVVSGAPVVIDIGGREEVFVEIGNIYLFSISVYSTKQV